MPLLLENAHATALLSRVMNLVKEAVEHLNPNQTPVLTMDQLLFTIAKEILWLWLNSFGKNKYVIMIGGLNVELATFKSLVVVEWFWMAKCSHNCWSCITWFCKIFCESILQGQGDSCSTACLCIPFLCGV